MQRDSHADERLVDSLFKLSREGRSWIAAEAALAKAELSADGKRAIVMFALAAVVLGSGVAAFVCAAIGLALLLAPHVGGVANATVLFAVVFAILAATCSWWLMYLTHSRLGIVSVFERWGIWGPRETSHE